MTIEEKAKAYDEALEQAKAYHRNELAGSRKEMTEYIFPELAESEDERIRKEMVDYFSQYKEDGIRGVDITPWIAYLEKQKEKEKYDRMQPIYDNLDSFESALAKAWKAYNDSGARTVDGCEDDYVECAHAKGFREGYLFGLKKQKEQSWMPTEEEMGVLYKLCYVSTQISDDDDTELTRLYQDLKREYFNGRSFENMFPKAEKEQKPIKMEVYEVGKGTTICGQDYKCKKDYKEGNCWYIKDVVYHCSRDGYLTDQNGISWSCTPEWFNEYIYTNNESVDEEKNNFVSGQFLQCKLSFDGFKEGEHYWLEYIGNDMYVGRSDNILNQKFHITPRQLYTLFSQQLEEVQGPPQEEKQVLLNYEPPFNENPSDIEIIDALIHSLNEQDGFLTAINCVSTKAILSWLEKQKEQKPWKVGANAYFIPEQKLAEKPINWTELTWKDINELEDIINKVHYEFRNGIGQESFGKEVLEKFREYKGDEYLDEIEEKPVDYEAELKKCKDNPLYFFDKYVSIKLKPAEWSDEDERKYQCIRNILLTDMDKKVGSWKYSEILEWYEKRGIGRYTNSKPHWKPSKEQMRALIDVICFGKISYVGQEEELIALKNQLLKLM